MPSQPDLLLKTVFGYEEFRPLQREIIENILKRRDTLAIMPTGGGKSLCYQIPALIYPGLTVVVSPLIALMKDQVEQLRATGVPALFLNSSLSQDEYRENLELVGGGKIKLLYVAPETLLTSRLFSLLKEVQFDCLVIDEAHCISEWGHDFRPEYRQLVDVRDMFPAAVCLALTATATVRVRADIKATLRFEDSNEYIASFNRENLLIEVAHKKKPISQALHFIQRFAGQSGIVYCFTRSQVDELAEYLAGKGYSVRPYHAGLADEERKQNQELFIRDEVQIIVATIAFGMGINKPNVRFILHYDLPKSIESYYQEIGRAGRDGLPAHCLLLYSYGDVHKLRYFIDEKEEAERRVAMQHLRALVRYAESDICRRVPLLDYFGEKYTRQNCGMCDNCLAAQKQAVDITVPTQKFLSCVKRTGELFGEAHITDVLLGSRNQKVLKFGHDKLSTYGIGKELTRAQWLHISHQLVQKGLLERDEQHHGLRLTREAYDLLKNHVTVMGVLHEADEQLSQPAQETGEAHVDRDLFEILKKKRKELAEAAQLPPYVIFPDKTLLEMATYYPASSESMHMMYGVGQKKLETYGQAFLEVIEGYCKPRNLVEIPKPQKKEGSRTPADELKPRELVVGEMYNAGKSVDELVDEFQVQPDTILEHLTRYALKGNRLRAGDDLAAFSKLEAQQQKTVMDAFAKAGVERLKPVFEALNETVDYDELKVMRLCYLSSKGSEQDRPDSSG
jgi:ATP-dependent DNA helicase RecQ